MTRSSSSSRRITRSTPTPVSSSLCTTTGASADLTSQRARDRHSEFVHEYQSPISELGSRQTGSTTCQGSYGKGNLSQSGQSSPTAVRLSLLIIYQIISYLQSHAHPQMYNSPPPLLHPTITDQLHLWDKERNRLQTEEGEHTTFPVLVKQADVMQWSCLNSNPRSFSKRR